MSRLGGLVSSCRLAAPALRAKAIGSFFNLISGASLGGTFVFTTAERLGTPGTFAFTTAERLGTPGTFVFTATERLGTPGAFVFASAGRLGTPGTFAFDSAERVAMAGTFVFAFAERLGMAGTFVHSRAFFKKIKRATQRWGVRRMSLEHLNVLLRGN